ncbi:MAG: multidrug effflux MFS transporter [Halioglobus sp.]|nr:multidrug effflux MFS transporter [Halioglobus sp.]
MHSRHLHQESPWLLALLAALVALGPLSVDMYLPAMSGMRVALDTDIGHMHLTLSAYLTGYALFHLLCGPLADRFGRKPILTGGTALFVLACLGCSQSSSVEELTTYRFVQGVGACVGPTLARTITRDVFGPTRAARALSLIAMLMALAPAVAPTLGGVLLLVLPWPSIFIFLAIYGAAMIVLLQRYLAESLPAPQSLHPLNMARNYAQLLVDPFFLSVTAASGLVYAGLLAYLASSGFIYMDMLGVPVEYFGLLFLTTVIGYMAGSALSARLSRSRASEQLLLLGAVLAAVASTTVWLNGRLFPDSVAALVLPMVLYSIGMGLVLPHAMAIALRPFPHIAGTASALMGFIQMTLSAAATALVGRWLQTSPEPVLFAMFVISLLALALSVHVQRRHRATKP